MGQSERLRGGELNAAVTREVVRIHTANLGRGPKKSFSFHNGNILITVMHEALTRAEQNLASSGEGQAVLGMRRLFQRTMREELTTSVEKLTGRRVVAFMSDNHLEPELAVEMFLLDGPLS
jgi:uncharacterized protein YbcI